MRENRTLEYINEFFTKCSLIKKIKNKIYQIYIAPFSCESTFKGALHSKPRERDTLDTGMSGAAGCA